METSKQTNGKVTKYFYSGVGFASHAKEIVQKAVGDVAAHGKVSEADGKKIITGAMTS